MYLGVETYKVCSEIRKSLSSGSVSLSRLLSQTLLGSGYIKQVCFI
jgi:hypothetical protein